MTQNDTMVSKLYSFLIAIFNSNISLKFIEFRFINFKLISGFVHRK